MINLDKCTNEEIFVACYILFRETEGGDDFDAICDLAAKSYKYLDSIIRGE